MRDKERDLNKLMAAFFQRLEIKIEDCVGLDSKCPFGGSIADDVLEIIGWAKTGRDYSGDQIDYAYELFEKDLLPHIQGKFRAIATE